MSFGLNRDTALETVSVEVAGGVDDQGRLAFAAPVIITAAVRRMDSVARSPAGEEIKTVATVWIPPDRVPMPAANDRLTLVDGLVGIVVDWQQIKRLNGLLDHVRVMLQRA